jgi:hypothetical protein
MAILAGCGPFIHFSVAPFTGFVGEILAKTLDFAPFRLDVTLGAVIQGIRVNLVVELHIFFELHNISRKGRPGKSRKNYDNNDLFHFASP